MTESFVAQQERSITSKRLTTDSTSTSISATISPTSATFNYETSTQRNSATSLSTTSSHAFEPRSDIANYFVVASSAVAIAGTLYGMYKAYNLGRRYLTRRNAMVGGLAAGVIAAGGPTTVLEHVRHLAGQAGEAVTGFSTWMTGILGRQAEAAPAGRVPRDIGN
jgi:hypothetical protein